MVIRHLLTRASRRIVVLVWKRVRCTFSGWIGDHHAVYGRRALVVHFWNKICISSAPIIQRNGGDLRDVRMHTSRFHWFTYIEANERIAS